ncbi:MAG: helix-turn-helix transcriptional regulator [Candidatus Limnocylindrales bacterium]
MDVIRFGLGIRALRRRRGWTQERLATEAGISRSAIQRIERGRAAEVAVDKLIRVTAALGAAISVRILWQGEAFDRLLDADHASLIDAMLDLLRRDGWELATEVSFNLDRERGSTDILAFHAATGTLLVVEVKSVVPDLQAMLHGIDRKARIAPRIARERGWHVRTVARLLVLPEDRTVRRRVASHATTFDVALPARSVEVRRWLRTPTGPLAGVLFLSRPAGHVCRHRVRG